MKIAIDPGHGMSNRTRNVFDSGATHNENGTVFQEAEIALRYGLTLKDTFLQKGHTVFMTRDDSTDHAPVGQRAGNAEQAGCDTFISLHLNDFDDDAANGVEVLYRGDDDELFAQALQDALVTVTGLQDREIDRRTDLAVLRFTGKAVLIELGFIANDRDRNTLLNPAMRASICEAIANVTIQQLGGTGGNNVTPGTPGVPKARVAPPAGDTLTVRSGPRQTANAVGALSAGTVVEIHGSSGIWRKIAPADERWVSSRFLVPLPSGGGGGGGPTNGSLSQITQIAASSAIASFNWPQRGVAPIGYIKGMALVFARTLCKLRANHPAAIEMAKAVTTVSQRDALAWYASQYAALGMDNSVSGPDTLRHLFVLMLGLGMRESSGQHCCGRDTSAGNTTAEKAEAGMFQTSWNARSASALMPPLFQHYLANPSTGFLDIFAESVTCSPANLANHGTGTGREYQRLSKECPAFHAEFTAVGLRNIRKHWGPINTRAAKLMPDADVMFREVQAAVDASNLCPVLI